MRKASGALTVTVAAVAVVAVGLWFAGIPGFSRNDAGNRPTPATVSDERGPAPASAPKFVTAAAPETQRAYRYAVAQGEKLAYIPCYCGCGGHSGHRNVRDCFIKTVTAAGVTYEEHGSTCTICVNIVLDVERMLGEGKTLAEARTYIDSAYAKYGDPTDTPMPPVGVTP